MTTLGYEIVRINRPQVLFGEDQTVFVTPFQKEGYAFRIAASLFKVSTPEFLHGARGDIVTFPEPLDVLEVRRIGKYANAGEILDYHRPRTREEFEQQMDRALFVTGIVSQR